MQQHQREAILSWANTETHWHDGSNQFAATKPGFSMPRTRHQNLTPSSRGPRFMFNSIQPVMRAAMEDRFEVAYQPCVDLRNGRVVHIEALLRWPEAPRGYAVPEVIRSLERSGMILQVGAAILRKACEDLARIRREGHRNLTMSVNLSSAQLFDDKLPALVEHALAVGDIPPSRLFLEMTETMIPNLELARRMLGQLRAMGVRTVIDDFGVGSSNLVLLRELPVHSIKLDKTFVAGVARSSRDSALASTIVRMATALGMDLIAEGVERAAQVKWLLANGVTRGQGFLFSPAVPLNQLIGLIQQPFKVPGSAR